MITKLIVYDKNKNIVVQTCICLIHFNSINCKTVIYFLNVVGILWAAFALRATNVISNQNSTILKGEVTNRYAEDVALHSSHVDAFWTNNDSMGRGSKIGPKRI